MISKSDIIELAQNLFRRRIVSRKRTLFTPVRDWYIGLALAGVIAVGTGMYGARLFVRYSIDIPVTPTHTLSEISYEKGLIEYLLREYESRRAEFEARTAGIDASELRERATDEEETEPSTRETLLRQQ